jgi:hypothetical protein
LELEQKRFVASGCSLWAKKMNQLASLHLTILSSYTDTGAIDEALTDEFFDYPQKMIVTDQYSDFILPNHQFWNFNLNYLSSNLIYNDLTLGLLGLGKHISSDEITSKCENRMKRYSLLFQLQRWSSAVFISRKRHNVSLGIGGAV